MLLKGRHAMQNAHEFLNAYHHYVDAIFRHCYFRVFDRERAKELTQDTFMRVWEYLVEGNEIENIRAFLYKVANNLVIDETRKKKMESLEEMQEQGFQPIVHDPLPDIMAQGLEMKELLKNLEPEYREVIIMRYIDDLTPREIAEVLGETADVVSVRIYRALEKMRKLLDSY